MPILPKSNSIRLSIAVYSLISTRCNLIFTFYITKNVKYAKITSGIVCNKTLLKLQIITAAKLKKSSSFSQFFSNLVTCEKKQIDIWYNLLTEYFCCCNFVQFTVSVKKKIGSSELRIFIRSRIDVWVIGANWTSPSYKINIPQFWLEV